VVIVATARPRHFAFVGFGPIATAKLGYMPIVRVVRVIMRVSCTAVAVLVRVMVMVVVVRMATPLG
jgi:hypothetical protein